MVARRWTPTARPWSCSRPSTPAAHNAGFDQSVLRACTVKVARSAWNLRPTRLPDVARHLRLPLTHHDAASDAEVCARIVLAAGADLHFAAPTLQKGDRERRG